MDIDVLAIAHVLLSGESLPDRVAKRKQSRLEGLAKARKVRSDKCRVAREQTASKDDIALMTLVVPGCSVLALQPNKEDSIKVLAMQKLAYSPRVRGSGSAVERVRGLQNIGMYLVGQCTLVHQKHGLQQWLTQQRPLRQLDAVGLPTRFFLRGATGMWGEAS